MCAKFTNLPLPLKEGEQSAYDLHQNNKVLSREEKDKDKLEAINNPDKNVFTFDLQSVLYTPCSEVSSFYYTRKFASYNNTFYDLATKEGECFLWHETNGGRGSDEIGSTIYKKLKQYAT